MMQFAHMNVEALGAIYLPLVLILFADSLYFTFGLRIGPVAFVHWLLLAGLIIVAVTGG